MCLRRIQRLSLTHLNKPFIFPKHYDSPHIGRGLWSQSLDNFEFTKDLSAICDSSFDSDRHLHYAVGATVHTFLGTMFSWKFENLFLPTNSTEAEIRTFYSCVKRTK